ncbi:hypothetical protein [Sphingomicrobium nitratireducens]|uniref:hypothetical protein n=1 Tax=Sphingomicrobium nitratireducens TaxID=2964666 RepID=UPI00223FEA33|nr:hypothetical protein [Sphingomicrobium nitratireducens]
MATNPNRAAARRYTIRLLAVMTVYVAALVGGQLAMKNGLLPDTAAIAIALVCGLCIALTFFVMGRFMVEMQDEFLRMLMVRQTLIAAAFALSLAAFHGFLSDFDAIPRVDAYWWPVLFFIGQFIGQVSNRLTYGTWGSCK